MERWLGGRLFGWLTGGELARRAGREFVEARSFNHRTGDHFAIDGSAPLCVACALLNCYGSPAPLVELFRPDSTALLDG